MRLFSPIWALDRGLFVSHNPSIIELATSAGAITFGLTV